jgi:alpha-L-fucosidase
MMSFRLVPALCLATLLALAVCACEDALTPEQEEIIDALNQREIPPWFDESKFGIFIHWGPYAIPAFAPIEGTINDALVNHFDDFTLHTPYVEWYWNALQFEDSATYAYHAANYGSDYSYDNFGSIFRQEVQDWDPQAWGDLFHAAGARYVVLVTKHHDGFLMWPSAHTNPNKTDWYSERDIVGELAEAVRSRGMRFGVYYSGGLDWAWNGRSARNIVEMGASIPIDDAYQDYAEAHYRDLIERYAPSVLWNDIAYPFNRGLWELQRDYYEAVPEGVVNDRFAVMGPITRWLQIPFVRDLFHVLLKFFTELSGDLSVLQGTAPPHVDFRTLEYQAIDGIKEEKIEVTRGMGLGFGYNQFETESDFLSEEELIHSFVDIVSRNGNLLLNVGPKANGDIPEIQATRLGQLGDWLAVNGEAIYGTRPWVRAEGETDSGDRVRFTQDENGRFAIVLSDLTPGSVRLLDVGPETITSVELLGHGNVSWQPDGPDLIVELPEDDSLKVAYTLALR